MKVSLFIALIYLIPQFFLCGCGEEDKLSYSIIGSWMCEEKHSLGINYDGPVVSGVIKLENGKSVLTFSKTKRFELISTYNVTHELMMKDSHTFEYSDVRFIIGGSYDVLENSISFYCDKSYSDIIFEPSQNSLMNMLTYKLNALEATYSGILDASINGTILELNDNIWVKI